MMDSVEQVFLESDPSGRQGGLVSEGQAIEEADPDQLPLLGLKAGDPEPIKRLKRELQVALSEEDYGAAIRIRDHPFMKLYTEIESKEDEGNLEEAEILRDELLKAIQESGEAEGE